MNNISKKQMIFAIVTMIFTISFVTSTLSNVLAYKEKQDASSNDGICNLNNHNSLSNQNTEIRTFGPNQPIIGLGNDCQIN